MLAFRKMSERLTGGFRRPTPIFWGALALLSVFGLNSALNPAIAGNPRIVQIGDHRWGLDSNGQAYAFKDAPDDRLLRFEVRNQDQRRGDKKGRERSELRTTNELPHGSLVTTSFGLQVEKLSLGHRFQILSQWHTKVAKRWGPWLSFRYTEPGKLLVTWSSSPREGQGGNPEPTIRGSEVIPCAVGEWCNIRLTVRTGESDGILSVSKNDKTFVDYHGPIGYFRTPNGDAPMGFMKIGIYRWHRDGGEKTVVNFRDFSVHLAGAALSMG